MSYKEMLSKDLIDLKCQASNRDELFLTVSKELLDQGLVEESYFSGLSLREENFPTGLMTQHLNIAIPHTDPEHIIKPFLYLVRVDNGIEMKQMGDSQKMSVNNFLFLGIKEPSKQVGLLQQLMTIFTDETFVNEFIATDSNHHMFDLLQKNI